MYPISLTVIFCFKICLLFFYDLFNFQVAFDLLTNDFILLLNKSFLLLLIHIFSAFFLSLILTFKLLSFDCLQAFFKFYFFFHQTYLLSNVYILWFQFCLQVTTFTSTEVLTVGFHGACSHNYYNNVFS